MNFDCTDFTKYNTIQDHIHMDTNTLIHTYTRAGAYGHTFTRARIHAHSAHCIVPYTSISGNYFPSKNSIFFIFSTETERDIHTHSHLTHMQPLEMHPNTPINR